MWPLPTAARAMFGNSPKAPEFFAKQFTKHLAVVYGAKQPAPRQVALNFQLPCVEQHEEEREHDTERN
jgi:hypothetical protein